MTDTLRRGLLIGSVVLSVALRLEADTVVRIESAPVSLTTEEVPVSVSFETQEGEPLPAPGAVRFTITVSGAAVFAGEPSVGRILEDLGPRTLEVESERGLFTIGVRDDSDEQVRPDH